MRKLELTNLVAILVALVIMIFSGMAMAHPIDDYYKKHKNDDGVEARVIPPKMAAMFVDEDEKEAIDILKSMTSLRYLNYYGTKDQAKKYMEKAKSSKGNYDLLLEENDQGQKVSIFGVKKKGKVRKIMALVSTGKKFLLVIGKGKLSTKQIKELPNLAKEF